MRAAPLAACAALLLARALAAPLLAPSDLAVFGFLFDSLGGPGWAQCANARNDPCSLCPAGVTCAPSPAGDETLVISHISLPFNNVNGWLPDLALTALTSLSYLDLRGAVLSNTHCLQLPMCYAAGVTCLLDAPLCPSSAPLEQVITTATPGVIFAALSSPSTFVASNLSCSTDGGGFASAGSACSFPFSYNGAVYTECQSLSQIPPYVKGAASSPKGSTTWCATSPVYNTSALGRKNWGTCGACNGPIAPTAQPSSAPTARCVTLGGYATSGSSCAPVFSYNNNATFDQVCAPFNTSTLPFLGKTYTKVAGAKFWCSTVANYSTSGASKQNWGFCVCGGVVVQTDTHFPTRLPTRSPSLSSPTSAPSSSPSSMPTSSPTEEPSASPTQLPSSSPTEMPSSSPTKRPTPLPTHLPTHKPTGKPTKLPTKLPTYQPSQRPSVAPTSRAPSSSPSSEPSASPTASPHISKPTRSPSASPTTEPSLCLPAASVNASGVREIFYDLGSQFGLAVNTPSYCPPWDFGWNQNTPNGLAVDFTPLDSMIYSASIVGVPGCQARAFPMFEPWGVESMVWKAFQDTCSALPARVHEPLPVGKVMLHAGRLTTPRVRFIANVTGAYLVRIEIFPGDARAVRGLVLLDNVTLAAFPTTDSPSAVFTYILGLKRGQALDVKAPGVFVNVPVDFSVQTVTNVVPRLLVGNCPTQALFGDLLPFIESLGLGTPSVCSPFTFGSVTFKSSLPSGLSPFPGGLYGAPNTTSACAQRLYVSASQPSPASVVVPSCHSDEVLLNTGSEEIAVVRFTTPMTGQYLIQANASSGKLLLNGQPIPWNSTHLLLRGDVVDLSGTHNVPTTIVWRFAVSPLTGSPTFGPSVWPTRLPSSAPVIRIIPEQGTNRPTVSPTHKVPGPSERPTTTLAPTTSVPSLSPSSSPTSLMPTKSPSETPTSSPLVSNPTVSPVSAPSTSPTIAPVTENPSSAPTKVPTDSPTSQWQLLCVPPGNVTVNSTNVTQFDLAFQFGEALNTPSLCPPWDFVWSSNNQPNALLPLGSLTASYPGGILSCRARMFSFYEPWGIESFVWKAFDDSCGSLPTRVAGQSLPIGKVMLHAGRLSTPRILFITPKTGTYMVRIQVWAGDSKSVGAVIALNNVILVTFASTDTNPWFNYDLHLSYGDVVDVWAPASNGVNVPLDFTMTFLRNSAKAGQCPEDTVNGDLHAFAEQLTLGSPADCRPFIFGYAVGSKPMFAAPMPAGLYGGANSTVTCETFASPNGPVQSQIAWPDCGNKTKLELIKGSKDTPVVRFVAQRPGQYQVDVIASAGGLVMANGTAVNSSAIVWLDVGNAVDVTIARGNTTVVWLSRFTAVYITHSPSSSPSIKPSVSPTRAPSRSPSASPHSQKPSLSPTRSPSRAPWTHKPSKSPSKSPTRSPSRAPITLKPSLSPSASPTTKRPSHSPTQSPSTSKPTSSPRSSKPSKSPSTSPISRQPSKAPASQQPSKAPTKVAAPVSPSQSPTWTKPSVAPVTHRPTSAPLTNRPSSAPTSSHPSKAPTSSHPSTAPTSSRPSKSPTSSPSASPTSSQPSKSPSSSRPSKSPTSAWPSKSPSTSLPSASPTSSHPSKSPSSSRPSKSPSSSRPSRSPASNQPSASPTGSPTPPPSTVYLLACQAHCLGDGYDYCDESYVIQSNFEVQSCGCFGVGYYPNLVGSPRGSGNYLLGNDERCTNCTDKCAPGRHCLVLNNITACYDASYAPTAAPTAFEVLRVI